MNYVTVGAQGTTARVVLMHEPSAMNQAVVQALYSRDPQPIDSAEKLLRGDAGNFLEKYYVGYGHASIGELARFTVCVENVPMWVAKLIQHHKLYRGTEASTRFIDFSTAPFYEATADDSTAVSDWRAFYLQSLEAVREHLAKRFKLNRAVAREESAVRAATFDVLRGFLPMGAMTSLSWDTDLRTAGEHIARLRQYHDMTRLRGRAKNAAMLVNVIANLTSAIGDAFGKAFHIPRIPHSPIQVFEDPFEPGARVHPMSRCTEGDFIEWEDKLDFASWRDLQRHRPFAATFPDLIQLEESLAIWTWERGKVKQTTFEEWYLTQLPEQVRQRAVEMLHKLCNMDISFNALPMCWKVPFRMAGTAENFQYMLRLRTGEKVHPTLRRLMQRLGMWLNQQSVEYKWDGAGLTTDKYEFSEESEWKIFKRGGDTITKKGVE